MDIIRKTIPIARRFLFFRHKIHLDIVACLCTLVFVYIFVINVVTIDGYTKLSDYPFFMTPLANIQ